MRKLVFRENPDKYDHKTIEAGFWYKRDDGSKFFSSILDISPVAKEVWTNCGDMYYDYGIGFNEFVEIADKIRELEPKVDKGKQV